MNLKTFNFVNVDAIYFKSSSDLFTAKTRLKQLGIKCYESDIIPEERYLMERFIYGSVELTQNGKMSNNLLTFYNPNLISSNYKPTFKILSLDIETGQNGTIYSFGMHTTINDSEIKKVFMRDDSLENIKTDGYITYFPNEIELIKGFIEEFNIQDPDIIAGWHVIGFDLDFIQRRCNFYNIPLNIGRGNTPISIRHNQNKLWVCNITGREVIDGPPALRGAFYNFESFKLEYVSNELLGKGKDITGSGKVGEIERRFLEDKESLAYYNLLDCALVTEIYNKTGLVDLTFTRAITSGLSMDKVGLSVAAFDYFMLPKIHRAGLVAPDAEDMNALDQGSGGLVFIKEPGFYNSIVVLDFKSLYPSIIRTFFIDPVAHLYRDENSVNTPVGVQFAPEHSILPNFIKELMDKRETAKKEKNIHLSQSIKILMNSFYGVMGTPLSRFYHPNLSKAITGTGQWLLTTVKNMLEEQNYQVIYGDTDSLFIELKSNETENYNLSAQNLTNSINKFLTDLLEKDFNVKSCLEIEYEKHFRMFFLPGLRGGISGAKKRYVGLLSTNNGEELTFTGLEYVRSDWTKLARDFQYELFNKIFKNEDVAPYIKETIKMLKSGKLDSDLYYNKRLTKQASEYIKIIPPQVKAALLLYKDGDFRGRIKYKMTVDGPVPEELNPQNIDYDHYIDKQLKPIAESILPFINLDFENIVNIKQPELF